MILFDQDGVVIEAEPSYSGATGERECNWLHVYRRGSRGGKLTIFRGEPDHLERRIALLTMALDYSRDVPERIELADNG